MSKTTNTEDIAAKRMEIISSLLSDNIDDAMVSHLKKDLSKKYEVSLRSIGRYLEHYEKNGFEGLKPKKRNGKLHNLLPNWDKIVDEAILLRRELPSRSVPQIITILELEGLAQPGQIKRSTLQGHLLNRGFGSKQMKLYTKKGVASRRFQKAHRGMLYQGDIKYGPYLPIGNNGEKKQVYLSAFIDDATRFIVHAQFYKTQEVDIIEDSLRGAIMRYGKPDSIYVDNGKQYTSQWLSKTCAKLGIRLYHAKPYHPEGKGKIESFNKHLDIFIAEAALSNPKSLDDLNDLLNVWISEYYHKKPHSSLGNISPEIAFKTDTRSINYVDANICADAFLHTTERKVDKTGCISFKSNHYEVGMDLIGRKVDVYYDPLWTDEIEIRHKDKQPFKVKILQIGENCGVKAQMPTSLTGIDAKTSRMLDGLNQSNITHRTRKSIAVNYRNMGGAED